MLARRISPGHSWGIGRRERVASIGIIINGTYFIIDPKFFLRYGNAVHRNPIMNSMYTALWFCRRAAPSIPRSILYDPMSCNRFFISFLRQRLLRQDFHTASDIVPDFAICFEGSLLCG